MRAGLPLLILVGCAAPSPMSNGAAGSSRETLSVGAQATIGPVSVRPLAGIEDSRCAAGAQCIWAGTVRIRAMVRTPGRQQTVDFRLGEPVEVAKRRWLTLAAVCPAPQLGRKIPAAAYRLTFGFGRDPTQAQAEAGC